MNPFRKWIRDAFGFSGNEINGFLILLPLMVFLILSEPVYHSWLANRDRDYQKDSFKLDSLMAHWPDPPNAQMFDVQNVPLFEFDPNTATNDELRRLGFSEISAKRIASYRRNGGVFRRKSDLLKIYDLDSTLYNRLYIHIKLPHILNNGRAHSVYPPHAAPKKKRATERFDLNTADTINLKTVYGIGSTLAARIVKFRDALGGFVKPEQLKEVYGLDSVVVKRLLNTGFIKPDFMPSKININTADEKTLSSHPYIRRRIAEKLVSYRFQHGDFIDAGDIKKISLLRPEEVDRLLPYVKISD